MTCNVTCIMVGLISLEVQDTPLAMENKVILLGIAKAKSS